jgi:hypothetical protein
MSVNILTPSSKMTSTESSTTTESSSTINTEPICQCNNFFKE